MEEAKEAEEQLIAKERTAHEAELRYRTRMNDHLKDQMEQTLALGKKLG
jgi:hypothetical protein